MKVRNLGALSALSMAALDALSLTTASGIWADSRPLRVFATLPFAIAHALICVCACSNFEFDERVERRFFWFGFPMPTLCAIPYGWLAFGASAGSPGAQSTLRSMALLLLIPAFLGLSAMAGVAVSPVLSGLLRQLRRAYSGVDSQAHVRVGALVFGSWLFMSCLVLLSSQSFSELRFSGSSLGFPLLGTWLTAFTLSAIGLLWSLVALAVRRT